MLKIKTIYDNIIQSLHKYILKYLQWIKILVNFMKIHLLYVLIVNKNPYNFSKNLIYFISNF